MKLKLPGKPKKKTTYPSWVFDNSPIEDPFGYGQRAVDFLCALCHPKSKKPGKAFTLDQWQERIVRKIYGPRNPDGTRIVSKVVALLPRGNRKTSLAAALVLLHLFGPERIDGGEVLSAASDHKQAKLAYQEAVGIIRATPKLAARAHIADYKSRVTNSKWATYYESISSDAGTQHGRTPTLAFVDELHAHKKRDLWDVIESGMPKTPGSLMIIATTAGRGQENIGFQEIDYARKVARGDIVNPSVLPVLFETSSDDDWSDEKVWLKANPGLSCDPPYPDLAGLRKLAKEAEAIPAKRDNFRQLNLNVWLDYSDAGFCDMDLYDRGKTPIDREELRGQPCWIGVDLGRTDDLSAVVAAFRDPDVAEGYIVLPFYFMAGDNLDKRTQVSGYPYNHWAETGLITATEGNVTDYRVIEDAIRDLCEEFAVREIAFDPHYAGNINQNLLDDGYPVMTMRQGWATMGPAIKELERAILASRFRHGGNPVLRWNFDNVAIQDDGKGNVSFHKSKSKDKIDGAVAAAMAVARAAEGNSEQSIYDTEERPDGLMVW